MNNTNLKILLVDDDPTLIEMHSALLENNNHSVLVADDGEKAAELLDVYHENIGVVVSDINMPKMDGYELCRKIKNNDKTKNMPVVIVSAYTGLDEKMKAYAAGADDYISKPVDEIELGNKIRVLLDIRQQQNLLSKQVAKSATVAIQVINYSSEIEQVIEFYNRVFSAGSYDSVAKKFFEIVSSFNLITILQIHTPDKVINISKSGLVTPLESNVIELARDKGEYVDYGARTIVNHKKISMLIKNMPLGDQDKYDRVKSVLGMIANALEWKITQLNNELIAQRKDSAMISIKKLFSNIETSLSSMKRDNIAAIEDMNSQLYEAIKNLSVTEEQERKIINISETCLERSSAAFSEGMSILDNLNNISKQLDYITGTET